MTHDELLKNHLDHLNSYRNSREYAEYARETGYPIPEGELPPLFGNRWDIDEEIYHEFLEMLPPLGWRGGTFYMSEFSFDDITAKYTKEGDKYYCEFARYPQHKKVAKPIETPWGAPDTVKQIADGITWYSTPSHGGFHLSPKRMQAMPEFLRACSFTKDEWFEEDCSWSAVALAFPQHFSEDDQRAALATLRGYKPEIFAQLVILYEQQGKHVYTIHYADREMAREQDDPTLGIVIASSKEEAEALAGRNREVLRRAVPCAGLWATEIKSQAKEKTL